MHNLTEEEIQQVKDSMPCEVHPQFGCIIHNQDESKCLENALWEKYIEINEEIISEMDCR